VAAAADPGKIVAVLSNRSPGITAGSRGFLADSRRFAVDKSGGARNGKNPGGPMDRRGSLVGPDTLL
jgi:hypothetical protein